MGSVELEDPVDGGTRNCACRTCDATDNSGDERQDGEFDGEQIRREQAPAGRR